MSEARSQLLILVIDDDDLTLKLITEMMRKWEVEVATAQDARTGLELYEKLRPDLVLVDFRMPNISGVEVLERIVAADPGAEIILMSGDESLELAESAIQKGACDFFAKPLDVKRLHLKVEQIKFEVEKRRRALQLDRELVETFQYYGMVGRSPAMLDVFARIRRVAPYFRTVLVTGQSGTGKELVAQALHRLSPVAEKPFIALNCAALPEPLLESELFGYMKGAFTGAMQDKKGVFETANGGTVFLDEIGELPLSAQAKLLRVLQSGEIQPVGSPRVRSVDVRIVACTNRELRALAAEKRFREDLYYRMSTVEVLLPPLAERKEDLPLLERFFLSRFAAQYNKPLRGITRRAQAVMHAYSWPGNVRELENVIANACMMTETEVVDLADLPEYIRQASQIPAAPAREESAELLTLDELSVRHAHRVLQQVGGDKSRAAKVLGISRATLYKLLGKAAAAGSGG